MIKCLTATVFAAQWDRIGSENKAAQRPMFAHRMCPLGLTTEKGWLMHRLWHARVTAVIGTLSFTGGRR